MNNFHHCALHGYGNIWNSVQTCVEDILKDTYYCIDMNDGSKRQQFEHLLFWEDGVDIPGLGARLTETARDITWMMKTTNKPRSYHYQVTCHYCRAMTRARWQLESSKMWKDTQRLNILGFLGFPKPDQLKGSLDTFPVCQPGG